MKKILTILFAVFVIAGCEKKNDGANKNCNIQVAFQDNEKKVTISTGVWGTISSIEGNCMPPVMPGEGSCTQCPVQRTVRIYEYTLRSEAIPASNPPGVFYNSFNTTLIKEVATDENGFYQVTLPPGRYSFVIMENGKIYANGTDGAGGLNPHNITEGLNRVDIAMTYKASF